MDTIRLGRVLRALRLRKGWRQQDLAVAAGVSQSTISLIERGHSGGLSIDTVGRTFTAVEARFEVGVSWRGGELDRLLDEDHARLVGATVRLLARRGWTAVVEVT